MNVRQPGSSGSTVRWSLPLWAGCYTVNGKVDHQCETYCTDVFCQSSDVTKNRQTFSFMGTIGGAKNDGHENDGPSKLHGMKLQDMKLQDMTKIDSILFNFSFFCIVMLTLQQWNCVM